MSFLTYDQEDDGTEYQFTVEEPIIETTHPSPLSPNLLPHTSPIGGFFANPGLAMRIQDERYHYYGESFAPPSQSLSYTSPTDFAPLTSSEQVRSPNASSGLRLDLEFSERLSFREYDTSSSVPLPHSPTSPWLLHSPVTPSEDSFTPDSELPLHSSGTLHPGFGIDHEHWLGRNRLPLTLRSRSPSVASSSSEGHFPLDQSRSNSVDPQLLSSPAHSSPGSTLYSSQNGSSSSFASSEPIDWHAQVASEKTKMASQKRRKKVAKFFCDVPGCHGSFTAKHNLLNHSNSHQGTRNFECPSCKQKFTTRAVLKRHMKTCRSNMT